MRTKLRPRVRLDAASYQLANSLNRLANVEIPTKSDTCEAAYAWLLQVGDLASCASWHTGCIIFRATR